MMYQNKLVVSIKANGKVLREQGENVFVPFGAEYSIYIKNLNSVRASVTIDIDGEDATGGYALIVGPNDSLTVERFIKNGNLNVGQRFKFIERTGKIEQHRGIGGEDGLIRVEYQFERVFTPPPVVYYPTYSPPYIGSKLRSLSKSTDDYTPQMSYTTNSASELPGLEGGARMMASMASATANSLFSQEIAQAQNAVSDVGITVGGSVSDQKFHEVTAFAKEAQSHVIVLHLRGAIGEVPVTKPITVEHKPECPTCGTKNKAFSKFCRECGTGLSMI
jgi:hypothetical protein